MIDDGVEKVRAHLTEARHIMYDEHWLAQAIDRFLAQGCGTTLLELAERCETAVGPDRELDREIAEALYPGDRDMARAFRPTGSLDDTVRMVPKDAWWSVMRAPCTDGYDAEVANDDHRRAMTPALALCAAVLRVRAA